MDKGLYLASVFLITIGLLGVWLGAFAGISESFIEMTPPSLVVLLLGLFMLPIALFKGGPPTPDAYVPIAFLFILGFFLIGWSVIFGGEGEAEILGNASIYLTMGEYWFNETNPNITMYQNYLVTVTLENVGEVAHSFMVNQVSEDSGYIFPGESATVQFIVNQEPGVYKYICTVPGHVELGMWGWWIIEEPPANATETAQE